MTRKSLYLVFVFLVSFSLSNCNFTEKTVDRGSNTDGGNTDNGDGDNTNASLDSDNDGLSDSAEAEIGSNPNNPDSDGDGLNDGSEIKTHRTDPLKKDTDGGGVDDGAEISRGTNPLDSSDDVIVVPEDSDGDGLSDATEADIGTDPNDSDSDDDNLSDGAEVQTHRTNPLKSDTDGGSIDDGTEVNRGTNPLDSSDDVIVVPADSDGDGLSDVIEATIGTDPNDPDSDDDGLTDGAEVQTHHTKPLEEDSDGGGVNDGDEVAVGRNPLDASDDNPACTVDDTDCDGLTNAVEAAQGTDPNDSDSDDDGLTDGAEVKTHHTNPLNSDSDSGGINDGKEISLGTNPLDASDDRLPDPPNLVFTKVPNVETTETSGEIEFRTENFPSIKSIECLLDANAVACQSGVPVAFSGLAVGEHQFTVVITDDDDKASSFSFKWEVVAPLPVDPCDPSVATKRNLRVTFQSVSGTCAFGVGDNLAKRNGFLQAINTQRAVITLPNNTKLCALEIDVPTQNFHFDDDFVLTWNDIALAAKGAAILSDGSDGHKVFDFSKVKGQGMDTDDAFCFGAGLGSSCTIPRTDQTGTLKLDYSSSAVSQLTTLFSERTTHNMELTISGDDDNGDCNHSGLIVDVTITHGNK